MNAQIKHICGHTREVPVKGKREAAQYKRWLASQKCPDCQNK